MAVRLDRRALEAPVLRQLRSRHASLDPVRSNALFLSFKRVRQHQADNQALVKKEKRDGSHGFKRQRKS